MQGKRSIVLLGDSIAKGIVQGENEKYEICPDSFSAKIANMLDCELVNWSRFGATIDKLCEIYERKSKRLEGGETFILECGGNDCNFIWPEVAKEPKGDHEPLTRIERFVEQYGKLVEKISNRANTVFILNLPPLVDDRFFKTVTQGLAAEKVLKFIGGKTFSIYRWQEAYSNALSNIVTRFNAKLIDIRTPFLMERCYEEFICSDGMHPNKSGHGLIARTLEEAFVKYGLIQPV